MRENAYLKRSREQQVVDRVITHFNRAKTRAVKDNPLPIGEKAIDFRTAKKRLEQLRPEQVLEYLRQMG